MSYSDNKIILISGASGFVGKNLISYLRKHGLDKFRYVDRNSSRFEGIDCEVFIHLAGKAHDVKHISDPKEYYEVNTELTKKLFDKFIDSPASVFITLSSVKATSDEVHGVLTEETPANPSTHYGKSKLAAEQYIFRREIPVNKRVYVLRPCIIHGPGNKGNLDLLYNVVKSGIPWPLGVYHNQRSLLSVENLCFVIYELINRSDIPTGIYQVSDDGTISTNRIVTIMAESLKRRVRILNIPSPLINVFAKLGDLFNLPLNEERLQKLTSDYIVSNQKLKQVLKKKLPLSIEEGLMNTFNQFLN